MVFGSPSGMESGRTPDMTDGTGPDGATVQMGGTPGGFVLHEPIGKDQIREAVLVLRKYKAGKANMEARIIENEQWWKLRHWDHIKEQGTTQLRTKSAWLVNVILSKHADAMDAYPEPNCLPRAADDEIEAKMLSSVLPVVLEQNGFEEAWSENWWKKLKAGVAIYGVFWDGSKLGGMGDIAIRKIDPLNLFWEPGVSDLQQSRNIFHVELWDNDTIKEMYPELEDKDLGKSFLASKYQFDDNVDTSDKTPVIDWYYKRRVGEKTVLHYVKFVGEHVLYATENDPERTGTGLYDHGKYPFFADVLFPEEGTPAGYGYIDLCKDAQRQIDLMNNAIVANCIAAATPRWMHRGDDGINEEEYADWTRPFVHVQGSIDDNVLKPIVVNQLTGNYLTILQSKIEEMKETSGNRDVNNGGTSAGVTAASAIAAMQEQSGKLSRDQISASYRTFKDVCYCVIDLIRQFYDTQRQFRITGEDGTQFVNMSNALLVPQPIPGQPDAFREVEFDIEVDPQKESPYSKISQNELALQLYGAGFFNPQMMEQAVVALDMMDFRGKDKLKSRIEQNGGIFMQMQAQIMQMQAMLGIASDGGGASGGNPSGSAAEAAASKIRETDKQGKPIQQHRNVEQARQQAEASTQPR